MNVDFDPGPGVFNMSVAGNGDAFVLALGPEITTAVPVAGNRNKGIFPNPVSDRIRFGELVSGRVFDARGACVAELSNTNTMSVIGLRPGHYVLQLLDGGTMRFIVE